MSLTRKGTSLLVASGYWLQLGRVDGEQAEGLGLDRRRRGDHRKTVSVVECGGHLVERAGGEVTQQAVEAVQRTAIGGNFAGALAQRRRRGLSRGDDRGALAGGGSGIVVIEQHGAGAAGARPCLPVHARLPCRMAHARAPETDICIAVGLLPEDHLNKDNSSGKKKERTVGLRIIR